MGAGGKVAGWGMTNFNFHLLQIIPLANWSDQLCHPGGVARTTAYEGVSPLGQLLSD